MVLVVSVKLQLDLPTFLSHNIWIYFLLCHIHRNLPRGDWINHSASGMLVANLQIVGWAVGSTGWVLIRGFNLKC